MITEFKLNHPEYRHKTRGEDERLFLVHNRDGYYRAKFAKYNNIPVFEFVDGLLKSDFDGYYFIPLEKGTKWVELDEDVKSRYQLLKKEGDSLCLDQVVENVYNLLNLSEFISHKDFSDKIEKAIGTFYSLKDVLINPIENESQKFVLLSRCNRLGYENNDSFSLLEYIISTYQYMRGDYPDWEFTEVHILDTSNLNWQEYVIS